MKTPPNSSSPCQWLCLKCDSKPVLRAHDSNRLVYKVMTLSKKGQRERTLVLDPSNGTLTRRNGAIIKDVANVWKGVNIRLFPEHGNRQLMYSRPGARHCNVVFRAASQRRDFVSNVRKIVNHLPIDVPYSMGEFKALQVILGGVLDSFRTRFRDESTFHVAALTFSGQDLRQALTSKPVRALVKERFPKLFRSPSKRDGETSAVPEEMGGASADPMSTIASKFLQYGIMKDRSGNNSKTRLLFRKLGLYRFSMSGLGTILDIYIATWNVGEKKPPPANELRALLRPGAEIYAIGLQECEHKAKRVAAIEETPGAPSGSTPARRPQAAPRRSAAFARKSRLKERARHREEAR